MAPAGVARPLPWGWPRPAPAARGAPSVGARRGGRSRDDRMTTDPELLPRPRLMRSLAGVWKLASLTAPAGWGKTTVLALAKPSASKRAIAASSERAIEAITRLRDGRTNWSS